MLALPVPGGSSAALPTATSIAQPLFNLVLQPDGLAAAVKGLQASLAQARADPGLSWLWGAAAAALVVTLLARLPDPGAEPPDA
jgi:hypothetical protein